MMNRVVSHIVADVAEDNTSNEKSSEISWHEESQDIKQWSEGHNEKDGRIHKTIRIHWDGVMNSVNDEMKPNPVWVFRDFELKMEGISVETVFKKGPAQKTADKSDKGSNRTIAWAVKLQETIKRTASGV